MNATFPREVLEWLKDNNMSVLHIHPLKGRFSASLFVLTVKTGSHHVEKVVCKLIGEESIEADLYQGLLDWEPGLAPRCIGTVSVRDGTALLLQRFGVTLTEALRGFSLTDRTAILSKASTKLAEMHAKLEHQAQSGERAIATLSSLQATAEPWRQKALDELRSLGQNEDFMELMDTLAPSVRLTELIDIARTWRYAAPNYYAKTSDRVTVTHGDPHLGNWLVSGDELRLIDWEYAGLCIPQRDLSIFLQDILDDCDRQTLCHVYLHTLDEHGWETDSEQFKTDFRIHFLDNTLMMLGWDIATYRMGTLDPTTFVRMIRAKSTWIRDNAALIL